MTGSESPTCQPFDGQCLCKRNVFTPDCSQCEPYHFGFHSGVGCARQLFMWLPLRTWDEITAN